MRLPVVDSTKRHVLAGGAVETRELSAQEARAEGQVEVWPLVLGWLQPVAESSIHLPGSAAAGALGEARLVFET